MIHKNLFLSAGIRPQGSNLDLSAQNDSVTKCQKEKRALEGVHQAEITIPFFFILSHSYSPGLGKGKKPHCLLGSMLWDSSMLHKQEGAVFFWVLTHSSTVKRCQLVPLPKRAVWILRASRMLWEESLLDRAPVGPLKTTHGAHAALQKHLG